jgi:hypothetical protein
MARVEAAGCGPACNATIMRYAATRSDLNMQTPLCSFGFLSVYVMISIAAPVYLRSLGKLGKVALICSVFGVGFMMLPVLGMVGVPGSSLFPSPAYPNNNLIWLFVAYMVIALGWFLLQRTLNPQIIPAMLRAIESVDLQFAKSANASKSPVQR